MKEQGLEALPNHANLEKDENSYGLMELFTRTIMYQSIVVSEKITTVILGEPSSSSHRYSRHE